MHLSASTAGFLLAATLTGFMACGTPSGSISGGDASSASTNDDLATPSVVGLSKSTWAAGDDIDVIGRNFVDAVTIELDGTFTRDDGSDAPVRASFATRTVHSNEVAFTFEADAPPLSFGDATGSFTGTIVAVNSAGDLEQRSAPLSATIVAAPSIVLTRVSPQEQTCTTNRITGTLSGELMDFEVAVTGLRTPNSDEPIDVTAAWIDTTDQTMTTKATITSGSTTTLTIDPGALDDLTSSGDSATTMSANIYVSLGASKSAKTITRSAKIVLKRQYEVTYDGNSRVVEVFEPEAVSGCLSGGQTGTAFSYSEDTSEEARRSYLLSTSVKIDVAFINIGFGFEVTDSVSSKTTAELRVSHSVLPHWFGAFYRQKSQLEKSGVVYVNDACGEQTSVGVVRVTDWAWAPGFNQKNGNCPPLPEPLMSEAGVVEL